MIQRKKIRWLAAVLSFSILCTIPVHAGAIQDQINSAGEKIDELENSLDQAEEKISAYQEEQKALEQEVSQGQEKISRLSEELDETKEAAQHTQEKIEQTQRELDKSIKESREQYEQMKLRIQFMYENSAGDMLTYVLEAGSLPEALRRANYFQAIVNYDREKLEQFKEITRKIKKAKASLVADKEELEALEQKQSDKLSEIDAAVSQLKSRLGEKLSQIQNSKALRSKYEQELEQQKAYEQELERQKAEEDRRRQEEIKRQEEELKRQQAEAERKRQEAEQRRQQQAAQQQDSQQSGGSSGTQSGQNSQASAGDLELLSTIIYCEAGNQSYEGQLAVGSVIMNRVASGSFPNSISGVIYQSGQFSPVASGRFAHALAAGLGKYCRSAAQAVLSGTRNVSCLYFRINNGLIDGQVIGDHVFY